MSGTEQTPASQTYMLAAYHHHLVFFGHHETPIRYGGFASKATSRRRATTSAQIARGRWQKRSEAIGPWPSLAGKSEIDGNAPGSRRRTKGFCRRHRNSRDLISRRRARGARASPPRPRSAGLSNGRAASALQPGHRHSPTSTDSRRVRDKCSDADCRRGRNHSADQNKRARLLKRPKWRRQREPTTSSS